MKALKLIYGSSFEPEVLEMLGDVFDDAWSEIAQHFNPDDDQSVRLELARTVLAEYGDGIDAVSLKQAVIAKMQFVSASDHMLSTA